ncbi:E3 ubiquitin-protein ligase SP1 [Diplonema papillatum]|nr:E3 ubiquitin-protein ligase SP1 [Diplonema papillatum]
MGGCTSSGGGPGQGLHRASPQWQPNDPRCSICRRKFSFLTRRQRCAHCEKFCCKSCIRTKRRNHDLVRTCSRCEVEAERQRVEAVLAQQHRQPPPAHGSTEPPETFVLCLHCGTVLTSALAGGHMEECLQRRRRRQQSQEAMPVKCPICAEFVHPALAGGHIEGCAVNRDAQRRKQDAAREAKSESPRSVVAEEEQCIICFEARRNIAFVPCGHWACCFACARKLRKCPICRKDISEHVGVDQDVQVSLCPVCRVHIHPTFFDGHREVCRLQLKQQRDEQVAEQEALGPPDEQGPTGSEPAAAAQHLCCLCFKVPREVATVPCGHYSMCRVCATTVSSCPVCFVTIRSNLPLYT